MDRLILIPLTTNSTPEIIGLDVCTCLKEGEREEGREGERDGEKEGGREGGR